MQRISLIVVLTVAWLAATATAIPAHSCPNHYRYCPGCYYGYDSGAIYDLSVAGNASRYIAQSERVLGQQIAAQQAAATQSGIRNAMSAETQRRADQIYNRQQANRDWWLEVQQQQVAERRQAAQLAALMPSQTASRTPKVATDLIKWPSLLQAPQFAERRRQIEAPYRRNAKGSSTPTAADYRDMIKSVEQMKLILKGMTASITAQEYLDSQSFLDRLAAQARQRLEKATPKK
jgi:hypothetical protein